MHYVVTLKVYDESNSCIKKHWYRVRNAEYVLGLDICSGDVIDLNGVGKLEVYGVEYQERNNHKNNFKALTITCGVVA